MSEPVSSKVGPHGRGCKCEVPESHPAYKAPDPPPGDAALSVALQRVNKFDPIGLVRALESAERQVLPEKALDVQVGGAHYKGNAIQPVEFSFKNGLGFCEGSVVKYVTRWKSKGGIVDLRKARHFLDLLIEMEEERSAALNQYGGRPKN